MKKLGWACLVVLIAGVFGISTALLIKEELRVPNWQSASENGWLKVDGAQIKNEHGDEIQLVGLSTHGIQWYRELYTRETLTHLKDELGINVFRIAMYTDPAMSGYVSHRELEEELYRLVDLSIELDLYVVVDWHILEDYNPQMYQTEAKEFFARVSEKYANVPNVIYEICNEPNGEISWRDNVKPYAEDVIGAIREHSPKALVIVGTPDWSKDLTSAAQDRLADENVAYALHFYAGSHNKTLRDTIDWFREKGLAVFVSECGATDASGEGKIYNEAFTRWADYMNEKKISWIYWSVSNKEEGSALLKPDFRAEKMVAKEDAEEQPSILDYLTESGQLFARSVPKRENMQ